MLADIAIAKRTVSTEGGDFDVVGLSLNSFAALVNTHLPDIDALFDLFAGYEQIDADDIEQVLLSLLKDAPGFVANVIALAAGEPDQAPKVERLPFPVQTEALRNIVELTFNDVGGPKNFLSTVVNLLGTTGVSDKLKSMKAAR